MKKTKKLKSKTKKKTTSQLKKILDKLVSEYIRKKYADKRGGARCFTCGRYKNWKEMQCGHFVSRQHLATRFDERNLRVQCVGCNVFGGGAVAIFANKLEEETPGIVNLLYRESQRIIRYYPFEEEIEKYRKLLEGLD